MTDRNTARSGTTAARGMRLLPVVIALVLTACEAPLVLDRVDAELQQTVRRSDRFQAAVNNGKVLAAVGSNGIILTSDDNGQSWSRHQIEERYSFIDITACADGSIAVLAIEGHLAISRDDGESWTLTAIESEETPQALTCDPGGKLWVVGSFASILSTADLGQTWHVQSLDDDLILTCVMFFDGRNGLVLGEFGTIARTADGGQTWEILDPLPDEFYPMAALFTDPDRGWVAGLHGAILYTDDGGRTWERASTETEAPIYGFAALPGQLYAVGGFGTVLRQVGSDFSGNRRWERKDPGYPVRFFLRAVAPVDDQRLLIGGGAGALHVVHTRDL